VGQERDDLRRISGRELNRPVTARTLLDRARQLRAEKGDQLFETLGNVHAGYFNSMTTARGDPIAASSTSTRPRGA
jgi:hypothetical protein